MSDSTTVRAVSAIPKMTTAAATARSQGRAPHDDGRTIRWGIDRVAAPVDYRDDELDLVEDGDAPG